MSIKEVKRWAVMRRVRDGELSLGEAAVLLGVCYRQSKRIYQRIRTHGQKGLVHATVGRRSNRAHPAALRTRAMALIAEHFSGPVEGSGQRFGPTLAAEHLLAEFGLDIPIPTLRRWMLAERLWSRVRKSKRARRRRARRAHFGELVQMDGSFHAWLEARGPVDCLLTMIDDATSQTLGQFTGEETTWGAAEVLGRWIAQYGVPQALYVDAKTVFVRPATVNELAAGIPPVTQFGRMCAKLGIRLIVANSPEAKGRVERVHGTNQDRLVKQLRRRGITTYAAANQFLVDEYFPAHNARFAVAAADPADFHLPLPPRFKHAHVFCLETPRVVGNDWVVRYANRALQIQPTARAKRHTGPKARILVRETRAGEILLVARTRAGVEHLLEWEQLLSPRPLAAPTPRPLASAAVQPPAGYTHSGKPLSAKQLAVRARWNESVTRHVQRNAAKRPSQHTAVHASGEPQVPSS